MPFTGLADADLTALAAITVQRTFNKGEIVFDEGDKAKGIYLLVSGNIRLCRISPDNGKKVVDFVMPGETFAEAALFDNGTYQYEARALVPSAALYFSKIKLLETIRKNPNPILILLGRLSLMTRQLIREFREKNDGDVVSRLSSFLVGRMAEQSRTSCGDLYLDLGIKKCELALRLGVAKETLSRSFKKLKDEGILEVRKNLVVIHRLEKLNSYAKNMKLEARCNVVGKKNAHNVMQKISTEYHAQPGVIEDPDLRGGSPWS